VPTCKARDTKAGERNDHQLPSESSEELALSSELSSFILAFLPAPIVFYRAAIATLRRSMLETLGNVLVVAFSSAGLGFPVIVLLGFAATGLGGGA